MSSETAERCLHDFGGRTMMTLVILTLPGELWVMSHVKIENPVPAAERPSCKLLPPGQLACAPAVYQR